MGWEDLPPVSPSWRQEFNACPNCERLEAELEETRGDAADFEAQIDQRNIDLKLACDLLAGERAALERERASVNELSLAYQDLTHALELIDTLSENRGPGVSWVKIYEEAQSIARAALSKIIR